MIDLQQPIQWQYTINASFSQRQGQYVFAFKQHTHNFVAKCLVDGAMCVAQHSFEHEINCYQLFQSYPFCPSFALYPVQALAHFDFPIEKITGQILILPYLSNLKQLVKPHQPVADKIRLFRKILLALAALHQFGWVHADLKFSHFMLQQDRIQLIDYAQSIKIDDKQSSAQRTTLTATPAYMAPELFHGQLPNQQSDLYALGIIFYEILIGYKPYSANDYQSWAVKHCQYPVPMLPAQFSIYQPLLDGLLAKWLNNRFKDICSVLKVLDLIENNLSSSIS